MTSQQNRLASGFRDRAVEFTRASERLASEKPFLLRPTFYCALHGIELALKSHLAAAGYAKSRLAGRELGHNLDRLFTEARKCGDVVDAQFAANAERTIKNGSKSYSCKSFEYPELFVTTVHIGRWIAIANQIICSADQKLKQTTSVGDADPST